MSDIAFTNKGPCVTKSPQDELVQGIALVNETDTDSYFNLFAGDTLVIKPGHTLVLDFMGMPVGIFPPEWPFEFTS